MLCPPAPGIVIVRRALTRDAGAGQDEEAAISSELTPADAGSDAGSRRYGIAGLTPRAMMLGAAGGIITGLGGLANFLGVAALAYPGPLEALLPTAVGLGFLGMGVCTLIVAALGTWRGTITEAQEAPAILLGFLGITAWQVLPADLQGPERLMAVLALFAAVTILTGAVFLFLGLARLGYLIRYVPFPVIGGVLASLGALLVLGALLISSGGQGMTVGEVLAGNLHLDSRLAATIAFCVLFQLVAGHRHGDALIPAVMLLGVLGVHAIAMGFGVSEAGLMKSGWLLGPFPEGAGATFVDFTALKVLSWRMIVDFIPSVVPIIFVAVLSMLLHATALELAFREDVDLDRDLRAAGYGNIAAGAVGGVPTFHSMSDNLLTERMNGRNVFAPLSAGAIWLAAFFIGAQLVILIPRPIVAGLVMFMGVNLVKQWIWDGFRQLPLGDWLVIVLIVLTVIFVGYIEGLALGAFAGIILFQIGYSRIDVVRHIMTLQTLRSKVERSSSEDAILARDGEAVLVLKLTGFIFFGTAHSIVRRIYRHFNALGPRQGAAIVLDLRNLDGLDWAAVNSLQKIVQFAEKIKGRVIFSESNPEVAAILKKGVLNMTSRQVVTVSETLDEALEICEERLLALHEADKHYAAPSGDDLPEALRARIPDPALRERLRSYLKPVQYPVGKTLMVQGGPADSLLIIRSGRASVYLENNDALLRVKSYAAGTVIGEIGLYRGDARSATVVAEEEVDALMLDRDGLEAMRRDDPQLATALDRAVIMLLSERLDHSNRLLTEFMD